MKSQNQKDKKGFTLIEVLAAIVILGILLTIGVVALINLRENQEKKFDQTQYNLFKESAKTYFLDNKNMLPTVPGAKSVIYLKDLINQNYIDSLLDYHKKSYQIDKSYVTVQKIGSKYIYEVFLYKEGKDADTLIQPEDKNLTIITFSNYKKDNNTTMNQDSNKTTYYTNQSAKIDIKIEDSDGIAVFMYFIYKNDKKIYTSEYIEPNSNTVNDKLTLNTNDYEDGTYVIEILVYDNNSFLSSAYSKKIMIDRVAPSCTTAKSPNTEWTNQDTTVIGICSDENGNLFGNSGCSNSTVSKTYTTQISANKTPGTVKDNAGNTTTCESVSVNIDKTKPTCAVTGGSKEWINTTSSATSRVITATCNDEGGSGCKVQSFSKIYTDDINTTTAGAIGINNGGEVYDNAGNKTVCAANQTVKIDKTPPACTVTGGNINWINSSSTSTSRTIKATCTDSTSGCKVQSFSKTYTDDINTTTAGAKGINNGGEVYDNAGNKTVCAANQTVKIDTTPPTCGSFTVTSGTKGKDDWYTTNLTLSVGCTDSVSGCKNTSYSKEFTEQGNKSRKIQISDIAGNTKNCTKKYKIDKTAPEFEKIYKKTGVTVSNQKWNEFGYYITDTGGSGVDKDASIFEYCYTGHTSSSCGATCNSGNQYSHYPSVIDETQKYYFQSANFDENNIYPLSGGILTECITGYKVRTNFEICDKAGNCSTESHIFDWSS